MELCNVLVGGCLSRLPRSHRALLTSTSAVWKTNIWVPGTFVALVYAASST